MVSINFNAGSAHTINALSTNERSLVSTLERLSTGKRINSAADDPGGLAISTRLTSQVNGLNQAARNINNAISMVQIADQSANTISDILQRMRELVVQASDGSNGVNDIAVINEEFVALAKEVDRLADTTSFNRKALLNGTLGGGTGIVDYQVGANAGNANRLAVDFSNFKLAAGTSSTPMREDLSYFAYGAPNNFQPSGNFLYTYNQTQLRDNLEAGRFSMEEPESYLQFVSTNNSLTVSRSEIAALSAGDGQGNGTWLVDLSYSELVTALNSGSVDGNDANTYISVTDGSGNRLMVDRNAIAGSNSDVSLEKLAQAFANASSVNGTGNSDYADFDFTISATESGLLFTPKQGVIDPTLVNLRASQPGASLWSTDSATNSRYTYTSAQLQSDLNASGSIADDIVSPITFANGSFETNGGNDSYVSGDVSGWTKTGDGYSGYWGTGLDDYIDESTRDGNAVAWLYGNSGALEQTLSTQYQQGNSYEFKVDIGDIDYHNNVANGSVDWTIEIFAGNTLMQSSSGSSSIDALATQTVSFDAINSAYNGENLTIKISKTDDDNADLLIDNVRGTVTSPNPSNGEGYLRFNASDGSSITVARSAITDGSTYGNESLSDLVAALQADPEYAGFAFDISLGANALLFSNRNPGNGVFLMDGLRSSPASSITTETMSGTVSNVTTGPRALGTLSEDQDNFGNETLSGLVAAIQSDDEYDNFDFNVALGSSGLIFTARDANAGVNLTNDLLSSSGNAIPNTDLGGDISEIQENVGSAPGMGEDLMATLNRLDNAIYGVAEQRALFGASINRLGYAIDNVSKSSIITEAARSQIEDANFLNETLALAKAQFLAESGLAQLAQANINQKTVFNLLDIS